MHHPRKILLIIGLPVFVVLLAWLLTRVIVRQEQAQKAREIERVNDLRRAHFVGWDLLVRLADAPHIPNSLEDCLKEQLITEDNYNFLTNHGARFHPEAWGSSDTNAVILEVLNGECVFKKPSLQWAWEEDWEWPKRKIKLR